MGCQRHAPAALPPGKARYPLYRRLGGSQGRFGRVRKISLPPRFDPRTVQPLTSRYIHYAIPASGSSGCNIVNNQQIKNSSENKQKTREVRANLSLLPVLTFWRRNYFFELYSSILSTVCQVTRHVSPILTSCSPRNLHCTTQHPVQCLLTCVRQ